MRRTGAWVWASLVALAAGAPGGADEEPWDKPHEVALDDLLKAGPRPPRSGVTLEVPKVEAVVRDGKPGVRVRWVIGYAGPRWPLVILKPSLDRADHGQTELLVTAKGTSGKTYRTGLKSPTLLHNPGGPAKGWFLTIPKAQGKAEGTLDADLAEVKRRFLKYYPDEFDPKAAPELYVQLELDISERGYQVDLDAWTGYLLAGPVKVTDPRW